jgi:catechol 2,3-dioxygenase-like lactoylglutathione lyase family enzyme
MRIDEVDHVELCVPDRYEAARLYEGIFGFEIRKEFEFWAKDPGGPLMVSPKDGGPKLALFQGEPVGQETGFRRVAFGASGADFISFVNHFRSLVRSKEAARLCSLSEVIDHDAAFSIYLIDPYGYRFEVTTYEHEYVRKNLTRTQSNSR